MELACGNTSSPLTSSVFPSVRSSTATPSTPWKLSSTALICVSSFRQRISFFCSVFSGQHACANERPLSGSVIAIANANINCLLLFICAIDIYRAQSRSCGLWGHRCVVDLFEGVGLSAASRQDRQDLDMPVVVLIDRLPILQRPRFVLRVRDGVQHHLEILSERAHPQESAA